MKKPLSGFIFHQNRMRLSEKEEKKKFSPEIGSNLTRAWKFGKISKKVQKPLSGIIFSQNWRRWAEKSRKKFQPRIPFILGPGQKISKKIAKKLKKLKHLFLVLFLAKTGIDSWRKRKKKFSPEFRSYSTQERKFRKKQQKNSKN